MKPDLEILNADEARFECTFGRGCDGICCREGRPMIYPEEIENLQANLPRILPLLRPEARRAVEKAGFLMPTRQRFGQRIARAVGGWCVFFESGCVLHRLGVEEGEWSRYKPSVCAIFPIQQDHRDRWYIRQHGYEREKWNLFCLNPDNSPVRAIDSLQDEIALASRFDREQKREAAAGESIVSTTVNGPSAESPRSIDGPGTRE